MRKFILFFIIILATTSYSYGFEKGLYEHTTYWMYSGETATLGWDPVPNADKYEIVVIHAETEQEIALGFTTDTSITFKLPRIGHYIFKVRTWDDDLYSDWAITTDPFYARVNGVNKSWWVYAQLPPVDGLGIE